jgi:hypothetical protein
LLHQKIIEPAICKYYVVRRQPVKGFPNEFGGFLRGDKALAQGELQWRGRSAIRLLYQFECQSLSAIGIHPAMDAGEMRARNGASREMASIMKINIVLRALLLGRGHLYT